MSEAKHSNTEKPEGLPPVPEGTMVSQLPIITKAGETSEIPSTNLDDEAAQQLAFQNLERRRKLKKRKRIIKIVVAIAVVLGVGLALALPTLMKNATQQEEAPAVASVERGTLSADISVTGSTSPINAVVVTPEVEGIITDIRVHEGDTVKKGDLLFTIKNDSLDRAVSEAQAQVQSAQDAITQAKRSVDQAYSTYTKAVAAYNAASEEERASMQDPDSLYAEVLSAQDSVKTAESGLTTAQTALKDAQDNANKRKIVAPIDGSIVALNAQDGAGFGAASQMSSNSGPLVQIADLSQLRVNAEVNEIDVTSLQIGQTAKITFAAIPGLELDAKVEHIATVSTSGGTDSYMGGGAGVVNYKVELLIEKPDPRIKPGMTANATIVTKHVENVLLVPAAAVYEMDGESYVDVVTLDDKGQIASSESKKVKIIDRTSSDVAIEGLNEGDLVNLGSSGGTGASSTDSAQG